MKKLWEKMKQIFKKFQSYSTWVSLSAAIVMLVTALGKAFGFSVENEIVENVVMSVAGVLVVLGLVASPTEDDLDTENEEKDESSDKTAGESVDENKNDDENDENE